MSHTKVRLVEKFGMRVWGGEELENDMHELYWPLVNLATTRSHMLKVNPNLTEGFVACERVTLGAINRKHICMSRCKLQLCSCKQ